MLIKSKILKNKKDTIKQYYELAVIDLRTFILI